MPVALDPAETFPFVFLHDKGNPNPPTLHFHYLTCRELRQTDEEMDRLIEGESVVDYLGRRLAALGKFLTGWENFKDRDGNPIPYDPKNFDAILSHLDISEVWRDVLKAMNASEAEKKTLRLSASSTTDNSAKSAEAESASIPQASASPAK
jgi:hypothetical protein